MVIMAGNTSDSVLMNTSAGPNTTKSGSSATPQSVSLKCMIGRSTNPTPEELMNSLRSFLTGQKRASELRESIYTGLWLIRHLPVSRDAVFDLISIIYLDFANKHLTKLEQNQQRLENKALGLRVTLPPDEDVDPDSEYQLMLEEIHATLLHYLHSSNEIWSPILSTWSLQLLGQISSDFSTRTAIQRAQSVNEVIKIWMGSKAIQCLLDLTSKCLKTIDHTNTNAFVSALLDTSAHHSPNFDWVIAHVGNTYPQTVVNEVLGLGLQHFSSNPPQSSRISSVDGILGYLATTHAKEVEQAFDQTIQNGLTSNSPIAERYSIPYLLQLCPSSVPLLDVLLDCAIPKVNEENLKIIRRLFPKWITLHFGGNNEALVALTTHLLLKSTRGPKALVVLINSYKSIKGSIGSNLRSLLDHFVVELITLLFEAEAPQKNFACILTLKESNEILLPFLIDSDYQISKVVKQIITAISYYQSESPAINAIVYYLRFGTNDRYLRNLVNMIATVRGVYQNVLCESLLTLTVKSSLEIVQQKPSIPNIRQWTNVLRLLKLEQDDQLPEKISLSSTLRENLSVFTTFLDVKKLSFCMEEASVILEILANVRNLTYRVRFGTILTLERYLVDLLFKILELNGNRYNKTQAVSHVSKLLFELSSVSAIQNDALRSLVQSSLNPECKDLFKNLRPSRVTPMNSESNLTDSDEYKPERFSMYVSLLNENRKRSSSVGLLRVQSTSFHSGRLAKQNFINLDSESKIEVKENLDWNLNIDLFIGVLLNVCMAETNGSNGAGYKNGDANTSARNGLGAVVDPKKSTDAMMNSVVSIEAMRKIALLLVEIVSPDVMFNGLPWPDEEFSKLQVERDLQIRRAFEDHPYLWNILELVAHHCPSLCYCSVLLRALMATLMAHWASCQEAKVSRTPTQLEWTIRLIEIMKTGQLIPPPLCHIGRVLPELRASEAYLLLKDIWWYMKANVPVPTAFIKDSTTQKYVRNSEFCEIDPIFVEKLRLVLLSNVETLGYLYPKLFPIDLFAKDSE